MQPVVRNRVTKKLQWGSKFIHRVVLLGVYADSPARVKLLNSASLSTYLGCFYCWMTGTQLHGSMRWAGYSQAARVERGFKEGEQVQMGVNDHEFKIPSEVQHFRGRAVEAGEITADTAGVHGGCIIALMLPYVDITRLFLTPFNHAFDRGVLRDLLLELLQSPLQLRKAREEHAAKPPHRALLAAEKAVAERTAARVSG